ncbi:MAG TPA: YqeG family HAD IIIA-type phosphatase [Bacillota bacterium]|nr:YqeG family HAD IIIA-type phosphatase [Bacillota bacterium]
MLKLFLPDEHVSSVYKIDLKNLQSNGIKGIITDLDNTLVAWDEPHATQEVVDWFKTLANEQFNYIIISNNNADRVQAFCDPIDVSYVHTARKPLRKSFLKAATMMNLKPEQVAVIGDQLLTDVLGGNLGGFYTILVKPLVETDAKITRFNRMIERRILNYFQKRGKIKWEE